MGEFLYPRHIKRCIESQLDAEELTARLRLLVDEPRFARVYDDHPFEGKVSGSTFDVRPIGMWSPPKPRFQFEVLSQSVGSRISLRISTETLWLIPRAALVLCILVLMFWITDSAAVFGPMVAILNFDLLLFWYYSRRGIAAVERVCAGASPRS
jgi:hypothetical protein